MGNEIEMDLHSELGLTDDEFRKIKKEALIEVIGVESSTIGSAIQRVMQTEGLDIKDNKIQRSAMIGFSIARTLEMLGKMNKIAEMEMEKEKAMMEMTRWQRK